MGLIANFLFLCRLKEVKLKTKLNYHKETNALYPIIKIMKYAWNNFESGI